MQLFVKKRYLLISTMGATDRLIVRWRTHDHVMIVALLSGWKAEGKIYRIEKDTC